MNDDLECRLPTMDSLDSLQIDLEIGLAWSVPAAFYTDPGVLQLELERIFRRSWQVVGHCHQVANPGDFFTTELQGEPLLLVRGAGGELKGFYNVCRHRAGPPAEGCGSRKVFRCGYHGWTYSLDGALLNAPEMEGVAEFSKEKFGLTPLRVEEWEGLVFANPDDNSEPLHRSLRELPQQAAKFSFRKMRLYERRVYEMACNWKTYIDNYLEGYHLPSVHPSLNRELDYNSYTTTLFERHSL